MQEKGVNILIINPFGIGDVLFTTPVVESLKKAVPESDISYWCNQRVADILRDNPAVKRVFALSRGDLKKVFQESKAEGMRRLFSLYSVIKKGKFAICLDFSLDHRYSLLAKLAGIKKRIGFNYKKRGRFLTHKIAIGGYSGKHMIEHYLGLLAFLDIKPSVKQMALNVNADSRIKVKQIFSRLGIRDDKNIIGIAPGAGASWGKDAAFKHWPAAKYAQLADRLIEELKAQVVILGDATERAITDKLLDCMHNHPFDLCSRTSLSELTAAIDRLSLLITNDGGPLHMAVARGIKSVSIFGPVDESVYGPYPPSGKHLILKSDISCRPCYNNFRLNPCEAQRRCIEGLEVNTVFEAVRRLL